MAEVLTVLVLALLLQTCGIAAAPITKFVHSYDRTAVFATLSVPTSRWGDAASVCSAATYKGRPGVLGVTDSFVDQQYMVSSVVTHPGFVKFYAVAVNGVVSSGKWTWQPSGRIFATADGATCLSSFCWFLPAQGTNSEGFGLVSLLGKYQADSMWYGVDPAVTYTDPSCTGFYAFCRFDAPEDAVIGSLPSESSFGTDLSGRFTTVLDYTYEGYLFGLADRLQYNPTRGHYFYSRNPGVVSTVSTSLTCGWYFITPGDMNPVRVLGAQTTTIWWSSPCQSTSTCTSVAPFTQNTGYHEMFQSSCHPIQLQSANHMWLGDDTYLFPGDSVLYRLTFALIPGSFGVNVTFVPIFGAEPRCRTAANLQSYTGAIAKTAALETIFSVVYDSGQDTTYLAFAASVASVEGPNGVLRHFAGNNQCDVVGFDPALGWVPRTASYVTIGSAIALATSPSSAFVVVALTSWWNAFVVEKSGSSALLNILFGCTGENTIVTMEYCGPEYQPMGAVMVGNTLYQGGYEAASIMSVNLITASFRIRKALFSYTVEGCTDISFAFGRMAFAVSCGSLFVVSSFADSLSVSRSPSTTPEITASATKTRAKRIRTRTQTPTKSMSVELTASWVTPSPSESLSLSSSWSRSVQRTATVTRSPPPTATRNASVSLTSPRSASRTLTASITRAPSSSYTPAATASVTVTPPPTSTKTSVSRSVSGSSSHSRPTQTRRSGSSTNGSTVSPTGHGPTLTGSSSDTGDQTVSVSLSASPPPTRTRTPPPTRTKSRRTTSLSTTALSTETRLQSSTRSLAASASGTEYVARPIMLDRDAADGALRVGVQALQAQGAITIFLVLSAGEWSASSAKTAADRSARAFAAEEVSTPAPTSAVHESLPTCGAECRFLGFQPSGSVPLFGRVAGCNQTHLELELTSVLGSTIPDGGVRRATAAVSLGCLVRRPSSGDNITAAFELIDDRPKPVEIISQQVITQTKTVAAAASVASIANPALASQAGRMSLILSLSVCNSGYNDPAISDSPLGLKIGSDGDAQGVDAMVGAVVGNLVMWAALVVTLLLVAALWYFARSRTTRPKLWIHAVADVRFPGLLVVPLMMLLQFTSAGVVASLGYAGGGAVPVVIGVIGLVLLVAVPICIAILLIKFRHMEFEHAADPRKQPELPKEILTTDERRQRKLQKRATVLNRFLFGTGKWVTTAEMKEKEVPFVRYFGMLVTDYRGDRWWFVEVELLTNMLLGFASGVDATESVACTAVAVSTSVIFVLYAIFLAVFRPYHAQFNQVVLIPCSIMQATGAFCMMVYALMNGEGPDWLVGAGSVLPTATTYVLMGKTGIDLFLMLLEGGMRIYEHVMKRKVSWRQIVDTSRLYDEAEYHDVANDDDSQDLAALLARSEAAASPEDKEFVVKFFEADSGEGGGVPMPQVVFHDDGTFTGPSQTSTVIFDAASGSVKIRGGSRADGGDRVIVLGSAEAQRPRTPPNPFASSAEPKEVHVQRRSDIVALNAAIARIDDAATVDEFLASPLIRRRNTDAAGAAAPPITPRFAEFDAPEPSEAGAVNPLRQHEHHAPASSVALPDGAGGSHDTRVRSLGRGSAGAVFSGTRPTVHLASTGIGSLLLDSGMLPPQHVPRSRSSSCGSQRAVSDAESL